MPGPAPSRSPRRTNARPEFRKLPRAGRSGKPPAWPLDGPVDAEASLWSYLWALPQAIMWEELALVRVVARYCRVVVVTEGPDTSAALLGEARQLEDRLGLTPMALKRLMWDIEPGDAVKGKSDGNVTSMDDYRGL